ncbi:uncharacterized protein LOC123917885 isoform X2 [Trifolium pratense]|uniref:uncharacterized protein LOC123917885 isoform X2 n=1 Tax=Trifolium pratense TaxID=57577 RepID=UPI001E693E1D|nr:uncharacterized protein LOC123917885 isoform X2 [Trifolium pratense]
MVQPSFVQIQFFVLNLQASDSFSDFTFIQPSPQILSTFNFNLQNPAVGEQIYTSYYSPIGARVKCLSYVGYFINARVPLEHKHIELFFSQIVTRHGSARNLPRSSTSRLSPRLGFDSFEDGMLIFPLDSA